MGSGGKLALDVTTTERRAVWAPSRAPSPPGVRYLRQGAEVAWFEQPLEGSVSDNYREGIRLETDRNGSPGPDSLTIEVHRELRGEVKLGRSSAARPDVTMRNVFACLETPTRVPALAETHVGVEDVESAVVGM